MGEKQGSENFTNNNNNNAICFYHNIFLVVDWLYLFIADGR
jgi:hypothetical protein